MNYHSFFSRVFVRRSPLKRGGQLSRHVRKPDKSGYPRQLRSFDRLVIAPYDDERLVEYLRAGQLDDLTTRQIRQFLVLLEQIDELGLSEEWIANHFEMELCDVAADLAALERKGYAIHIDCKYIDDTEAPGIGWVFDPDQFWADTELLYGDFALM